MKFLAIDYAAKGSMLTRTAHYTDHSLAAEAYGILKGALEWTPLIGPALSKGGGDSIEYPVTGGSATIKRSSLVAVALIDCDEWEDMQVLLAKRNADLERRQKDATGSDLGFQSNGGQD
jgi:hypothetical protein